MSKLLSRDEIETITDCVQGAAQCKVLTDNKILFIKDRNGLPHVTWEALHNPIQSKTSNLGSSFWSPSCSVEE
jgi:hypothetical protein|tara:strand:- start:9 stop:227 length:219 start_codon:yes stop_codon:yes gene_type:complete